jgi:hypothetical protein
MAFWFQRTQISKPGTAPLDVTINGIKNSLLKSEEDEEDIKRQPEPGKSYADAVKEPPSPKSEQATSEKKSRGSGAAKGHASGAGRLWSLILGTPSDSGLLNAVSLAINGLLLVACLYFQFYPLVFNGQHDLSFARAGATGDTWVKVVARVPPSTSYRHGPANQTIGIHRARVIYRLAKPRGKWLVGPEFDATNETDWVGHVRLDSLYPATEYDCW